MNIYQRIAKVMEEVAYIRKDKKVETYMAVTHDQVTAMTRPSFVKHGIVIAPSLVSAGTVATGTSTGKGTPIIRNEAVYDVRFVNIEEPSDFVTVRVEAHANDHGDKAPGKSLSYATKYAVLKILQIETGESDEGRVVAAVDDGHEGIPEKKLADLCATLDEATDRDDLRVRLKAALAIAKAGGDSEAHARIKAYALSISEKVAQ